MASTLENAGLTPQQSIVNPDGTPTMFFFRWLLSMRGAAITTADLEILETFTDGALDAALANILAAAGETFLAAEFAGEGAAAGELGARVRELEEGGSFSGGPRLVDDGDGDRYALEAFMAAPAPADPAAATGRDVIANIPAGLGLGDGGRTFDASDYGHRYRWSGTAWAYDDPDPGSGYVAWFLVPPRMAAAKAWQLCDGSSGITESRADGTAGLVAIAGHAAGVMPDLRAAATAALAGSLPYYRL